MHTGFLLNWHHHHSILVISSSGLFFPLLPLSIALPAMIFSVIGAFMRQLSLRCSPPPFLTLFFGLTLVQPSATNAHTQHHSCAKIGEYTLRAAAHTVLIWRTAKSTKRRSKDKQNNNYCDEKRRVAHKNQRKSMQTTWNHTQTCHIFIGADSDGKKRQWKKPEISANDTRNDSITIFILFSSRNIYFFSSLFCLFLHNEWWVCVRCSFIVLFCRASNMSMTISLAEKEVEAKQQKQAKSTILGIESMPKHNHLCRFKSCDSANDGKTKHSALKVIMVEQ